MIITVYIFAKVSRNYFNWSAVSPTTSVTYLFAMRGRRNWGRGFATVKLPESLLSGNVFAQYSPSNIFRGSSYWS